MPLERSTLRRAVAGVRAWIVGSPRWLLLRRLAATSVPLTVAVALCLALNALLPTAFTLVFGGLIGALPEAVGQGPGSPAQERLTLWLGGLGLIFVGQQVVMGLTFTMAECLGRRVLGDHARRVMRATMRPAGLAHLERPASLDQIARALSIHWVGPHAAVTAMVQDASRRLQGFGSLLVVAYFEWWVAVLLLAALVHSTWRFGPIRRQLVTLRMGKAQGFRRAEYFLDLTLRPETAKEVRVFGLADWLVGRYERAWLGAMAELWTARSNLWTTVLLAGLPVVLAELLGLGVAGFAAVDGTLGVGELVVFAGGIRWATLISALGDADSRIEHGASGLRPTMELERGLASDPAINPPGTATADGLPAREIRFEGVAFGYPDRPARVFDRLDLVIPAGRSLAIVGDNGAGKTTLVKLLTGLYEPTAGRIAAAGVDLRRFSTAVWRERTSAGFQDFARFELVARESVGVGSLADLADASSVETALDRAEARDVVATLPAGLETQLGASFDGGAELSGGQWQKLALGRAMMRTAPLLLVLDEPTAALDAQTEHALFERYAGAARQVAGNGAITMLVSHRFSTVRMAELIVVVADGRVVETGSHADLISAGGLYAELYELQAHAYR